MVDEAHVRGSDLGASEGAEEPPKPVEERVVSAWRVWLTALASDAEAAHAAALAYEALDPAGRSLWLDALDQDVPKIDVPRIAIYAPLLWVETDPDRRARIAAAAGPQVGSDPPSRNAGARALSGTADDGDRVIALVRPLHLDFAQVLACRFGAEGFVWVKHDPIVLSQHAPMADEPLEDVLLEHTPVKLVVEDLALAVLAHRRTGRPLPDALHGYADLFDAPVEGE